MTALIERLKAAIDDYGLRCYTDGARGASLPPGHSDRLEAWSAATEAHGLVIELVERLRPAHTHPLIPASEVTSDRKRVDCLKCDRMVAEWPVPATDEQMAAAREWHYDECEGEPPADLPVGPGPTPPGACGWSCLRRLQ